MRDSKHMRNLHISTVGKTTDPIKEQINAFPIDNLILLFDKGSQEEALELKKLAEDIKISCELEEINKFDMEDIFAKIRRIEKKYQNHNIYINVTGGTKVMSNAALIAGYHIGAEMIYIKENIANESLQERILMLPIPKVKLEDIKTNQIKILVKLLQNKGVLKKATSVLSDELKLKPQLISYHLKEMENVNLIIIEKEGRDNVVKLTNEGSFAAKYYI